jgi:hypothetical protein
MLIQTWHRKQRGQEQDLQKNAFCLSYFIIIHQCTKLYKSSIVVVVHKHTIFLFFLWLNTLLYTSDIYIILTNYLYIS